MNKPIIVIDIGTQSLRAILYSDNAELLFESHRNYGPVYKDNEVEQDPRTWKNSVIETLKEVSDYCTNHSLSPSTISITSQRASIIPVNQHGKALYNAITWQDRRSYEQCDDVKKRMSMQDIYKKTGLRLDSYFSAPKMLWLKENMQDIYLSAHKIIGVQDYVTHILTNRFVTDHTQAARTLLMDIHTFKWDDNLIKAFKLDKNHLPDLVPPGTSVGTLSDFIIEKTGLDSTIDVVLAGGDQQCAAVGLNVLKPGTIEANIGTGSFIIAYAEKAVFDENMRVLCSASAIPGQWILEAGLLTSGNIYAWYNREFYKESNPHDFSLINKEVNSAEIGAKNLILIPHFKGSAAPYWNPLSKGIFFNATLEHTRADFARSILEGIAMEMSENIQLIENLLGYADIIHAAGGLTKFDTFNQIQADMFNKAVSVYDSSEATALGALISALVQKKVFATHQEAFNALSKDSIKRTFHAEANNIAKYMKMIRTKKILYQALNDAHIYTYMTMK